MAKTTVELIVVFAMMTALISFTRKRFDVNAWSEVATTRISTRTLQTGGMGRTAGTLRVCPGVQRDDASRTQLRRWISSPNLSSTLLFMRPDESLARFSTSSNHQEKRQSHFSKSREPPTWGTKLSLSAGESHSEKSAEVQSNLNAASSFSPGTEIMVEVVSFGPMGASVNVIAMGHNVPDDELPPEDEPPLAKGLILQKEIHLFRLSRGNIDVNRGEVLGAYVERIRDTEGEVPKLDICLRAFGASAKASEASVQILSRLNSLPAGSELPIGDKSPHDDIGYYFPGMSKTAFKRAVGNLFDQKKVWPSPYSIRLYTESDVQTGKRGKSPNRP